MYSTMPPDAIPFAPGPRVPIAWVEGSVAAGFPSPADDFTIRRHDLNELLIQNPASTFMWRAIGESMIELGISSGDILVCDRSLDARHTDIVIAEVEGSFTVKQLWRTRGGSYQLRPGNSTFPPLIFRDPQLMTVCGVVTATIKRFLRGRP